MKEELAIPLQATIDVDGMGTTIPVGPVLYKERWKVTRYSINLTEGRGSFRLYRDYVDSTKQIDDTDSGDSDTSENNSIELQVGNKLIAQWINATPGATGTIVFYGEKYR